MDAIAVVPAGPELAVAAGAPAGDVDSTQSVCSSEDGNASEVDSLPNERDVQDAADADGDADADAEADVDAECVIDNETRVVVSVAREWMRTMLNVHRAL